MIVWALGRDHVEGGILGFARWCALDRVVDALGLLAPTFLLFSAGVDHGAGVAVGLALGGGCRDLGFQVVGASLGMGERQDRQHQRQGEPDPDVAGDLQQTRRTQREVDADRDQAEAGVSQQGAGVEQQPQKDADHQAPAMPTV